MLQPFRRTFNYIMKLTRCTRQETPDPARSHVSRPLEGRETISVGSGTYLTVGVNYTSRIAEKHTSPTLHQTIIINFPLSEKKKLRWIPVMVYNLDRSIRCLIVGRPCGQFCEEINNNINAQKCIFIVLEKLHNKLQDKCIILTA